MHWPRLILNFVSPPIGWRSISPAGILAASRAVETMVRQAVVHGATLQEECRVMALEPHKTGVTLALAGRTGREIIHAEQVVLAAGPWNGGFFAQLGLNALLPAPLRVTHQQVVYFEVEKEQRSRYDPALCPVYICLPMPHFYGFPIWEQPGQIKIGLELDGAGVDPNTHPRDVWAKPVAELCDLVANHLVGVIPKAVSAEACLYTHSPDQDFIIDRHPAHPQILLAGGFTGRGFKFTILIGQLLADLAALPAGDYSSPLWRDCFGLHRFQHDDGAAADPVLKL